MNILLIIKLSHVDVIRLSLSLGEEGDQAPFTLQSTFIFNNIFSIAVT